KASGPIHDCERPGVTVSIWRSGAIAPHQWGWLVRARLQECAEGQLGRRDIPGFSDRRCRTGYAIAADRKFNGALVDRGTAVGQLSDDLVRAGTTLTIVGINLRPVSG